MLLAISSCHSPADGKIGATKLAFEAEMKLPATVSVAPSDEPPTGTNWKTISFVSMKLVPVTSTVLPPAAGPSGGDEKLSHWRASKYVTPTRAAVAAVRDIFGGSNGVYLAAPWISTFRVFSRDIVLKTQYVIST